MTVVLDASAVLAMLLDEPGGEVVETTIADSIVSAVNWSEVVQKAKRHGIDMTDMYAGLQSMGLTVVPFNVDDAEQSAYLWQLSSSLALADRACLALGIKLGAPVWTADRYWATVESGAEVRVIR